MPTTPVLVMLAFFALTCLILAWQNHREKHRIQRWLANCNQKCQQYLVSVERSRLSASVEQQVMRNLSEENRMLRDAASRRSNPVLEKQQ